MEIINFYGLITHKVCVQLAPPFANRSGPNQSTVLPVLFLRCMRKIRHNSYVCVRVDPPDFDLNPAEILFLNNHV